MGYTGRIPIKGAREPLALSLSRCGRGARWAVGQEAACSRVPRPQSQPQCLRPERLGATRVPGVPPEVTRGWMGDPEDHVMPRPLRAPLRRSFSDHIRDSTARALDAIWKNTRERRLAGEGHGGERGINQKAFKCTDCH